MEAHVAKSLVVAVVLALMWPGPSHAGNTYSLNADFDKGTLSNVNHDAPGVDQLQLSLNATPRIPPYLWVANYLQDTVTKIDTRTGRQVGMYDSVLARNWDGTTPVVEAPRSSCNSPSRTMVDANDNAFVANRGFCPEGATHTASVTKIGGKPEQCVDRNGNGRIDTSHDESNDGLIDVNDPAEFLGQDDECLLWTRNYAAPGDHGRSIAADADQNVWLGGNQSSKLYKLSNETGALLGIIDPVAETGVSAKIYGLAIGPKGFIYTSDNEARVLQRIDPNAPAGSRVKVLSSPVPTYGIAVNKAGIVWLGNWSRLNNGGLVRVDFEAGTVSLMSIPSTGDCRGNTRGVAVDGKEDVWAACWSNNRLLRFNSAGVLLGSYPTAPGTLGVAIDSDNKVWTSNMTSDTVTRVDPAGGGTQSFPAGGNPYSYWDMTGFQHRTATIRQGEWTVVHDSGTAGKGWGSFHWNHEPEGLTPPGTSILVYARAADDRTALQSQPFVEVSNDTPFTGVNGRYVQAKAVLRAPLTGTPSSPVLSDLTVLPRMCWKDVTVDLPGDEPPGYNVDLKESILQHKAVLLQNGQVLSVGGWNVKTTRLFTPDTDWSHTGHTDFDPLNPYADNTRRQHTATLLLNGKVLVTGGYNGNPHVTTRVYDSAGTKTWTAARGMNRARKQHTATLLPNGHVLVVGGEDNGGVIATAELYNPDNDTWTPTGSLSTGRRMHTATLLPDGRVLVTGGYNSYWSPLASAEVYSAGSWTPVGNMSTARVEHTATLLPDGSVLVAGGNRNSVALGSSAEIFKPGPDTWMPTRGRMKRPRSMHAAVLLKMGMVLVTGGYHDSIRIQKSAEVYNPVTGTWIATCDMNYQRQNHTMTLLDNGGVLVIGGESQNNHTVPLSQRDQGSSELLAPP